MFFWYFFFYDVVTSPEKPGFQFNSFLLILSIQIINLILIFLNLLNRRFKLVKNETHVEKFGFNNYKKEFKIKMTEDFDIRIFLILFGLILSLICLGFSTTLSNIPNKDFKTIHEDYRSNFTFFNRVPNLFFIFLTTSILCLTLILFYSENKYVVIISISLFMYCLWILPYLQTGNYFGEDSYNLMTNYRNYLKCGIRVDKKHTNIIDSREFIYPINFFVEKEERGGFNFRYSTGLFTAILLTTATGNTH